MDKVWFIAIEGKQEGPFSIKDLKRDPRVTPDTLVWREGFPGWIPIRNVQELKEIFKDEPESQSLHEDKETKLKPFPADVEPATLTMQSDPSQFFLWLLALILLILYLIYLYQSP